MIFRIKKLPAVISGVLLAGLVLPGTLYAQNNLLKANGVSDATAAAAYYATIDPANLRMNQSQWEEVNGFHDSTNQRVVVAGHKNVSDLGFFRRIEMVADRRPGKIGNVAYYTVNYRTEYDAVYDLNRVSIVNMEYSPVNATGDRITKFYIYDGQTGMRLTSTVFDPDVPNPEHLYLPNVCSACHGGGHSFAGTGSTGGGFLAFDFNVFEYGSLATRASQEGNVKKLNIGVLMTDPDSPVKNLLSGLYGGRMLPRTTQNSAYRPSTWDSEPALYNVLVTDCMGCHTLSAIEILDLSWWKRRTNTLRELMFDPQEKTMPNAPYSNRRFWNTNHNQIALDALNRFDAAH